MRLTFWWFTFDSILSCLWDYLGVEEFRDVLVRVDSYKSWSYARKNVVIFVSFNQVVKDFRLVEDIHLAHIIVVMWFTSLERALNWYDNIDFAPLCLYWALKMVVIIQSDTLHFQIGLRCVNILWGFDPMFFLVHEKI
jgi:hypothetical protein